MRVTLEWQDLLRVQLRALMRASGHGQVRLLLPMITSLDEVQAVHRVFEETRAQLLEQGYAVSDHIPVGVMIEVPSTLWILDDLFSEVDFISVGTNDLVQYLLAVDRDNVLVAGLYDPQHPAVVRALGAIAEAARRAGKSAAVCGEIASDEAMAVLLAGMGYDALSVNPTALPRLKFALSTATRAEAEAAVEAALAARSADEVRDVLGGLRERLDDALLRDAQE